MLEREESDEQCYLLRSRGPPDNKRRPDFCVSPVVPRQPCPPAKRQKASAGRAGFSRGRCNSTASNQAPNEGERCSSVASNPVSEPSEAHGSATKGDNPGNGWLAGKGPSPVPRAPESSVRAPDAAVRQACANLEHAVAKHSAESVADVGVDGGECDDAIYIGKAAAMRADLGRPWPLLVGPTMMTASTARRRCTSSGDGGLRAWPPNVVCAARATVASEGQPVQYSGTNSSALSIIVRFNL